MRWDAAEPCSDYGQALAWLLAHSPDIRAGVFDYERPPVEVRLVADIYWVNVSKVLRDCVRLAKAVMR